MGTHGKAVDFAIAIAAPLTSPAPCGGSVLFTSSYGEELGVFSDTNPDINGIRGVAKITQVELAGNCCFVVFKKRYFGPGPSFRVDYRGSQAVPRQLKTVRSIQK